MTLRRIVAAARAWWASTHPDAVARDLAAGVESARLKQNRLKMAHDHVRVRREAGQEPRQWALDLVK